MKTILELGQPNLTHQPAFAHELWWDHVISFDVNREVFDKLLPKVHVASFVDCRTQMRPLITEKQAKEKREFFRKIKVNFNAPMSLK